MHYSILWIIFQKSAPRYWHNLCLLCADVWYGDVFTKWTQILQASYSLRDLKKLTDEQLKMVSAFTADRCDYLISLCKYGKLEILVWYWKLYPFPIYMREALRVSAENGHLKVVKWLWKTFNCNREFYKFDRCVLMYGAKGGHIEICCWMLNKERENWLFPGSRLKEIYNNMFVIAACAGHIDFLQWIHSLKFCYIKKSIPLACRGAAEKNNLETLKWLLTTYESDKPEISKAYKKWDLSPEIKKWLENAIAEILVLPSEATFICPPQSSLPEPYALAEY